MCHKGGSSDLEMYSISEFKVMTRLVVLIEKKLTAILSSNRLHRMSMKDMREYRIYNLQKNAGWSKSENEMNGRLSAELANDDMTWDPEKKKSCNVR